ncbi:uncharacterized protein LOC131149632 [Malania oleifera]|uniref:uncharacterized protein LOC131149632 n=1 Tax=Malania oleifera TaxID=397392 RepID=UPI0025AE7106|nr:uncharacterized protein LOC131149632 [Malania oleifera]
MAPPETTLKEDQAADDKASKRGLDREVRQMVSALTHRLADLQRGVLNHKPGASDSGHRLQVDKDDGRDNPEDDDQGDDHGIRIITLAGSNTGAAMRGEYSSDELKSDKTRLPGRQMHDGDDALSTYVNSNFQAINNSIMLGGDYSTNDPGVHLDISDYFDDDRGHPHSPKHSRGHGKKAKSKDKESSSSKTDKDFDHRSD